MDRPAVIVIVPSVSLWSHFRYVARLESYEELEAASALALRYGQLSEPVLTALASDASDANPLPNVMRAWLRLASLFQLAYEASHIPQTTRVFSVF